MKSVRTFSVCLLLFLFALPAFAEDIPSAVELPAASTHPLDSQEYGKVTEPVSQDIKVYVNEQRVVCEQPPYILNGRTLVPLRAIFEALEAEVYYHDMSKTIVAGHKERDRLIALQIHRPFMAVHSYETAFNSVGAGEKDFRRLGQEMARTAHKIDVPPVIYQGRTMVPVRVISEALGSHVSWDAESSSVWVE